MKSPDKKPSKKPYHPPRLVVYGDLRAITRAVGATSQPDGGPMMLMAKS